MATTESFEHFVLARSTDASQSPSRMARPASVAIPMAPASPCDRVALVARDHLDLQCHAPRNGVYRICFFEAGQRAFVARQFLEKWNYHHLVAQKRAFEHDVPIRFRSSGRLSAAFPPIELSTMRSCDTGTLTGGTPRI